jgi:uncharacterized protein YjbI with pentapeptide repeats
MIYKYYELNFIKKAILLSYMDFENLTLQELLALIESNDKQGLTKLLLDFKDKWNSLVEENKKQKTRLVIKGLNLNNENLSGINLSNVDIEDSDFSGSNLSDSDFTGAIVKETKLDKADLSNSKLYMARFTQTSMAGSKLYNVDMQNIYMTGSVNLFSAYWNERSDEETYRTHPEITKRGFRQAEAYEQTMGDENEDRQNYY